MVQKETEEQIRNQRLRDELTRVEILIQESAASYFDRLIEDLKTCMTRLIGESSVTTKQDILDEHFRDLVKLAIKGEIVESNINPLAAEIADNMIKSVIADRAWG